MSASTELLGSYESLAAITVPTIGPPTGVPASLMSYSIEVDTTGSPTFSVNLEGSLSGTAWTILGTVTSTGIAWFSNKPCTFLRANCTALSGGTLSAWVTSTALANASKLQF
jgi:hypothetical protein